MNEIKRLRKMRQEIAESDVREIALQLQGYSLPYDSRPLDESAQSEIKRVAERRQRLLAMLDEQESRYLINEAHKWGIEVPYKQEWHYEEVNNPLPDPDDPKDATYLVTRG